MSEGDAVTTQLNTDSVSATGTVAAAPSEVFEFLRRPANHAVLSGDQTVRGATGGDEVLADGSRFSMKMKVGVPYRVTSRSSSSSRTGCWRGVTSAGTAGGGS